MTNLIKPFLENSNIKNKKILIALSGGPDSVSLLYLLNQNKEIYNLELEAAYVNHGLREEHLNKLDLDLVTSHCKKLNIILHIKTLVKGELINQAKINKDSVEAAARNVRYNFFNSLVTFKDLIAVGHNRDDQIETQVMRFFQGSSIEGLKGIKGQRDNIIRPLIDINKTEIIDYLKKNRINYNIDHTNNELDYLRNKIRHNLIPVIEDIFPGYKKGLKNISIELHELSKALTDNYSSLDWKKKGKILVTAYTDFINLPTIKRREEIFKLFDKTYAGSKKNLRLPKRFLEPLNKDYFKNNEIILSGHGIELKRDYDNIIWKNFSNNYIYFKIYIAEEGIYSNSFNTFSINKDKGRFFIPGLSCPFSIKSIEYDGEEVKILKKEKISLQKYNKIFVVEKNNHVYAIINRGKIIYLCSTDGIGLYLDQK